MVGPEESCQKEGARQTVVVNTVILALERQKQEDGNESKTSLVYIARLSKQTSKTNGGKGEAQRRCRMSFFLFLICMCGSGPWNASAH